VISYVSMGDLDLDVLANVVRANLAGGQVCRVAIDSLAELVLADREWVRFPAYMRSLVGLVRAVGVSLLATSETTGNGITAQSLEGAHVLVRQRHRPALHRGAVNAGPRNQRRQDAEQRAPDDHEQRHDHRRGVRRR
jgi:hypothetical protein